LAYPLTSDDVRNTISFHRRQDVA